MGNENQLNFGKSLVVNLTHKPDFAKKRWGFKIYEPFRNSLPKSNKHMHLISARNFEMDAIYELC